MRTARIETADGVAVCERCLLADSFAARFRGFMARPEPAPGEGILFRPGGSIHMFFMRYPLDVVFCDRDLRVVGVASEVRPWWTAGRRGAKLTLELRAGEAARRGVVAGTQLRLVDDN
jgi:uncharacterized membrane protein (UPF0127 family)